MKKTNWIFFKPAGGAIYTKPQSLTYLVPLSTWHFDKYYRKNKFYGGVVSRDSIPKIKKKFYIINLDDKTGPGTHWVVLYNLRARKRPGRGRILGDPQPIYFDSFGVWPPKELSNLKGLVFNDYRLQALTSKNCGLYCMYVIDELQKGREFLDILLDFSPIKYNLNESKISKHFAHVKI